MRPRPGPWRAAAARPVPVLVPVLALVLAAALAATVGPATAQPAADARRSGLHYMSPALQAMQRDDGRNPAMLSVEDGALLWRSPPAPGAKACAVCHGEQASQIAGAAARYPAWDVASGGALNLAGRVNACRQRHQQAPPLATESAELLSLTAWLALQSRGQPLAPPDDPRLAPLRRLGETLWQQRLGQLNLACTQCHDGLAGRRLGGATIPQAHATGYPVYRLEWQGLGSLQRRLRGCVTGVRAQPWVADAPEWLALEAYLAQRAAGLPLEAPAVRP